MPFRNPIVAGNTIIPQYLQSANWGYHYFPGYYSYLYGYNGWRIGKDGTAEFSEVILHPQQSTTDPKATIEPTFYFTDGEIVDYDGPEPDPNVPPKIYPYLRRDGVRLWNRQWSHSGSGYNADMVEQQNNVDPDTGEPTIIDGGDPIAYLKTTISLTDGDNPLGWVTNSPSGLSTVALTDSYPYYGTGMDRDMKYTTGYTNVVGSSVPVYNDVDNPNGYDVGFFTNIPSPNSCGIRYDIHDDNGNPVTLPVGAQFDVTFLWRCVNDDTDDIGTNTDIHVRYNTGAGNVIDGASIASDTWNEETVHFTLTSATHYLYAYFVGHYRVNIRISCSLTIHMTNGDHETYYGVANYSGTDMDPVTDVLIANPQIYDPNRNTSPILPILQSRVKVNLLMDLDNTSTLPGKTMVAKLQVSRFKFNLDGSLGGVTTKILNQQFVSQRQGQWRYPAQYSWIVDIVSDSYYTVTVICTQSANANSASLGLHSLHTQLQTESMF